VGADATTCWRAVSVGVAVGADASDDGAVQAARTATHNKSRATVRMPEVYLMRSRLARACGEKHYSGSLVTSAVHHWLMASNYFAISTSAVIPQRSPSGICARSIVTV
jgi:hypothetical protein